MYKFFQTIKAIKKLKNVEPSRTWLRSQRLYFANMFKTNGSPEPVRPVFNKLRFVSAFVMVALIAALGGGAVNSAQAALPADLLYPLKLLSEQFQSFIIVGNENKIDFALKLAEKRLEEAEAQTQVSLASASGSNAATTTVAANDEELIIGTVFRAQANLEKAESLLKTISEEKSGRSKDFKNLEKALKQLDRLAEHKNRLAERFADKLPALAEALDAVDLASVNVEQQANKIIITFNFDNATSTVQNSILTQVGTSTPIISSSFVLNLFKDRAEKAIERAENKIRIVEDKLSRFLGESSTTVITLPLDDDDEDNDNDENEDEDKDDDDDLAKKESKRAEKAQKRAAKLIKKSFNRFEDVVNKLEDAHDKLSDAKEEFAEADFEDAIHKANEAFKKAVEAEGLINRGRAFIEPPQPVSADTTAPVISQIVVVGISQSSATITWLTSETSDSKINFGTSITYGQSVLSATSTTAHSLALTGLGASTTIHFQVQSKDASGNTATSTEQSFTTLEN